MTQPAGLPSGVSPWAGKNQICMACDSKWLLETKSWLMFLNVFVEFSGGLTMATFPRLGLKCLHRPGCWLHRNGCTLRLPFSAWQTPKAVPTSNGHSSSADTLSSREASKAWLSVDCAWRPPAFQGASELSLWSSSNKWKINQWSFCVDLFHQQFYVPPSWQIEHHPSSFDRITVGDSQDMRSCKL